MKVASMTAAAIHQGLMPLVRSFWAPAWASGWASEVAVAVAMLGGSRLSGRCCAGWLRLCACG